MRPIKNAFFEGSWFWKLLVGCFLSSLVLGVISKQIFAQASTPSDDAVNQIASQLYFPTCENITLDDCTTQSCRQMRALIREQLAEGLTEQEIKDYFVAQYGEKVLGEPPARGLNWVLYVLPPLAFLIGVGAIIFYLKKKPTEAIAPPTPHPTDDPYLKQVEHDLKKLT
jgi:cytochrome c-type biogenesis protein CcmH